MKYGDSTFYQGIDGAAYFARQNKLAALGAEISAPRFAVHIRPTDACIDFGCAGGWILSRIPCSVRVGVEVNKEAHATCRANGVEVYRMIDEVPRIKFDVAITSHCLEHVPYPIEALRELRELLKADGKLVVVVPIDDWRSGKDLKKPDLHHHLHTWTPRCLANSLDEAGFKTIDVRVITHALFPHWEKVYKRLPISVFNALCVISSIITHRRQLLAVGVPK